MVTINGRKKEHAMMLETGVLQYLLDKKWTTYVKVTSAVLNCCPHNTLYHIISTCIIFVLYHITL